MKVSTESTKQGSEQTLQDELRALRDECDERYKAFDAGETKSEHYLIAAAYAWLSCELERLLAKQAAPASQPGVSADQLRQASEQAFMNIPDPHISSAHFNEMARLLNAALAAVPQPAAAPVEPPNEFQCCCNVSWLDLDERDCPVHNPHIKDAIERAVKRSVQRDRELKERCVRLGIDETRDAITQAQGYLHAAAFLAIQELNPAAIAEKVPNE